MITLGLLQMIMRDHLEYHDSMNTRITGVDRWINQQTGEIIEAQTIAREVKEVDIGFDKLWIGHILEAIEEVGNAKVKVLFWLLKNKDANNLVKGSVTEIATATAVGRATVARLMTALRKADVVRLECNGRWLINPAVVFKGGHDRRMNVLIRYKTTEQQQTPLEISPQKHAA